MCIRNMFVLIIAVLFYSSVIGQTVKESKKEIPVRYEEITAGKFKQAVEKSQGTCIIPFGILEKHGPHLPLGTDMINVREWVLRAVEDEYTIVFPQYYFGQIFEARQQPGTIAYSREIIMKLLQETCDELSRNGFKKIIIVNGHGGNNSFLKYFGQVQLDQKRDYVVYVFAPQDDAELTAKLKELRQSDFDGHAGEVETSAMMAHRPDLVDLESADDQTGTDQDRQSQLQYTYTGIWWYAKFPNHYAGEGQYGNAKIGELVLNSKAMQLLQMIRSVKDDDVSLKLQNQFYQEAENPLNTKQ